MENIVILHNPKCSKSRCALNWIKDNQLTFEVRDYLKEQLTIDELKNILGKINCKPSEILRSNEKDYLDFVKGNYSSEDQLLKFMVKFPKLIQRPIVTWDNGGVLARPLEKLIEKIKN